MNALESYCYKHGAGLDFENLNSLRHIAKRSGIEERCLASGGYSYFPAGASTRGRLFKIAEVKDRLFLEFNVDLAMAKDLDYILYLNDDDRRDLHAGGVKFCYIGDKIEAAYELIDEILSDI